MPTRDDLHRIVDQLPEAVLEHAERVLEHCLTWPQPSPDVLELRDRVHKRKHQVTMEGRQQAYDRRVPGELRTESRCIPPGTGYVSNMSWINDELVQVTVFRVQGQEVERIERVGLAADRKVKYSVEVIGPAGGGNTFDADFPAQLDK
jgi:hypothetical protein